MAAAMSLPTLRDYQQRAVASILRNWQGGARRVILELPTGAGKTLTAGHLVRRAALRGERVAIIAHRRELLAQLRAACDAWGLAHGDCHSAAPVLVDSVARRWPDVRADLLVIDEAHRAAAQSYRRVVQTLQPAQELHLTATPVRTDRQGLPADAHVVGAEIRELQDAGYLRRERYLVAGDPTHLSGLRMSGADFARASVEDAFRSSTLRGDIVAAVREHIDDRQAVLFAASVEASEQLAEHLTAAGLRAVHVDGKTSKADRDAAFDAIRGGEARVLCCYDVASEGVDLPTVSMVVMATATASLIRWRQRIGRGLRPGTHHRDCLVLDGGGNVLRLGWVSDPMPEIRLGESTKRRTQPAITRCPSCFSWLSGRPAHCPHCEHEFAALPPGTRADTVWQDGEWVEVLSPPPEHLRTKDWKLLRRLQREARARGFAPAWAYARHDDVKRAEWRREVARWRATH
jgi:superfamily II DNA or RNA helicase